MQEEGCGVPQGLHSCIKTAGRGAGEMEQQSRGPVAVPEDPGSIPAPYMLAHKCLCLSPRGSGALFCPSWVLHIHGAWL